MLGWDEVETPAPGPGGCSRPSEIASAIELGPMRPGREPVMQRFVVEDSFWDLFPDASVACLVVRGMRTADEVGAEDRTAIAGLLEQANRDAARHLDSPTLAENAPVKVWREAYRSFKTKRGARCSIENLLKRVLKDNPVGPITPSVDLYNIVSLRHAFPVGGEDVNAFVGDLRLGVTEGGDAFRGLGEEKDGPTLPGEVCYRDDEGAVCRCLNWRDGQRTALSDDSRDAFLVIESVDPGRSDDLAAAIDELGELVGRFLGGTVTARGTLTRESPELVIVED